MSNPSNISYVFESDEVIYSSSHIVTASSEDISTLKALSEKNPRKRCRLCAHPDSQNTLHDMLIVHGKGAYVRPHKHIGKSESLHVIEGTALMLIFDDMGNITRSAQLGELSSNNMFFYRMPEDVFHSLIITSEWFVFHESTTGPFDSTKTEFPDWAPDNDDDEAIATYQNMLVNSIDDRDPSSPLKSKT